MGYGKRGGVRFDPGSLVTSIAATRRPLRSRAERFMAGRKRGHMPSTASLKTQLKKPWVPPSVDAKLNTLPLKGVGLALIMPLPGARLGAVKRAIRAYA